MSSFYPIDLSLLNYTTPVDLVYSNYRNSTVFVVRTRKKEKIICFLANKHGSQYFKST